MVGADAGVALQRASQAMALLNHRDFVTPDDIKAVANGVLTHRIITQERSLERAQQVIDSILSAVPVPLG